MSQLDDPPQGGQAQAAWARPARSKAERRAHVLHVLESQDKLWIATASADGSAHLVPFSFVWDGERITVATRQDNPAALNGARTGKARVALGHFGDVVLIDGPIGVVSPRQIDGVIAERLSHASAIDARHVLGFVYLQLTPWRVQAWWSGTELSNPTIMRNGQWLAP